MRRTWAVNRYSAGFWAFVAVLTGAVTLAIVFQLTGPDNVIGLWPFMFGFYCLAATVQAVRAFRLDRQR